MVFFLSVFGHRKLAVFFSLAGVFLMSSSCTLPHFPPIQCVPGSKTFTVAGNGTSLNKFKVPALCSQLTVRAWGGGGGGGGGHASHANSDNTGYGGGGGASGGYATAVLFIVFSTPPPPYSITANTLLTIDVGAGGPAGAGQSTSNVDVFAAPGGGAGKDTMVYGTADPYVVAGGGGQAGGGGTETGGGFAGGSAGPFGGFNCTNPGSYVSGVGGGNGGGSCWGGGGGGAGGADPGCNNLGKNGSAGAVPGGGGGGGAGGRTCGWFGGRHSGGSGGKGANGQVTISWQ